MALPAVTMERIKASFTKREVDFEVESNGDIVVGFYNAYFIFRWIDDAELLHIFGFWRGTTSDPHVIAQLEAFIDEKNSNLYLPKINGILDDDGSFGVNFEYFALATGGLTDEQLDHIAGAMLSFTFRVIDTLEAEYPELVTWEQPEDEA